MASAGSIFVDLLLRDAKYNQGWQNASRTTKQATGSINRDVNALGGAFGNLLNPINNIGGALQSLAGFAATAFSTQKIIQYSDTFRALESRLKLVTGSAAELEAIQASLFDISQSNAQPLEATIDAYTRLQNSLTDTQKAQVDLVRFTELLSKTLTISGTNAAGAATFFQQFGQAASSDFKAVGQELQTFADQNPRFYRILQDEARKYGKTLKQMAADGELSFGLIANATLNAGEQIDGQSEQIALTVGRALTQLDNAFLEFIGNNKAVEQGTSSLAIAISSLAQNLDVVAKSATLISGVFAARLIPGFITATTSMGGLVTGSIGLQVALARMAGATTAATTAFAALTVAGRGALTVVGALGGPIGVAFIAVLTAVTFRTNEAAEAEERYQGLVNSTVLEFSNYASKSEEAKNAINRASNERIRQLEQESLVLELLVRQYADMGSLELGAREVGSYIGLADSPKDLLQQYEGIRRALDSIRQARESIAKAPGADPAVVSEDEKKRQKSINDLISSLKAESDQLNIRVDLFGQEKSAIDKAIRSYQTYRKLQEIGGKLDPKQEEDTRKFLENIAKQEQALESLNKEQERVKKLEEERQRTLEDLGNVIGSAFEDAIVEGGKLSDVLNGLLQDILRIVARLTITKPLVEAIGGALDGVGSSSGGGGSGGLLGSIFGGLSDLLPSYDVGSWRVNGDQVAKIHDGEMIIPSNQADMLRRGTSGIGGGGLSVVVNNYSNSDVAVNQRETNNGLELEVVVDQMVANKVASQGSSTNVALNQRDRRSLVRR